MGLLFSLGRLSVVTAVEVGVIIISYLVMGGLMAAMLPQILPGYVYYDGLVDAQGVMLMWLVWDRCFGNYAKLIRRVASLIEQKHGA